MASNDSGLDSSNDSNDIGAVGLANPTFISPEPILLPPLNLEVTANPIRLSPPISALLPIPTNLPTAVGTEAAPCWHKINPKAFQLNTTTEKFAIPYSIDIPPMITIRPSSLPSGSHSYKMRLRGKQRTRNCFPGILAESNGRKLRTAASTCNVDMLTRILELGFDPNAADEYKRTALHLAACRGYIQIVQQLLNFGANPNVVDSLGNTPLHLAVISASSNNFNVVARILLRGGASVHIQDRSGKNPLDLAESKLRLLRTRYSSSMPETARILEDMCLLTSLIMRYLVKQQKHLDDLQTLEQQLQNLSTSDNPEQEMVVPQAADALLAGVERLSLGK